MHIVGFCGLIGCGKTTAAMYMVKRHDFWRRRFAGPLKDMMQKFGLTGDELDGHLKEAPCDKLGGKTPRMAMQLLGTEWGRRIDPDIWVKAWKRDVESCAHDKIVADDVRFPNEAHAIKSMGGILIKVERPGLTPDAHASEQQDLQPDRWIRNDGSVEELLNQVEAAIY